MEIQKTFELSHAPAIVWDALSDVRLVASCLPGASILEQLGDGRYKGQFSVKVGPLAAAFEGDVTIERRPEERTGTVSGKGADARSSSRASGHMAYRVAPAGEGERTRVDVNCTINLAGALAQFGKAGVIKEIANRITAEFVRNLEAHLAAVASRDREVPRPDEGSPAAPAPSPSRTSEPSLDAGRLVWAIVRERIAAFFRFLFGRRA
jgi:carbon monoxide dehydrogenase subunit G